MQHLKDYREHFGTSATKPYHSRLFESPRLALGLYCLEPGQAQALHAHQSQDTFYVVLEGEGLFSIGGEEETVGEGTIVWAPAGVEHGVQNRGAATLVVLVGIAPAAPT